MAKHKKPIDYYDVEFDDESESDLVEEDIIAECGKKNSVVGQALYQRGFVSQRSFDGQAVHATIQDGLSPPEILAEVTAMGPAARSKARASGWFGMRTATVGVAETAAGRVDFLGMTQVKGPGQKYREKRVAISGIASDT